jgi:hypothetical protein
MNCTTLLPSDVGIRLHMATSVVECCVADRVRVCMQSDTGKLNYAVSKLNI